MPVRRVPASSDPSSWQVLLVQSRWTPDVWLFPKGSVEEDESGKEAAVRETCEEGGVVGDLGPKLGMWLTHRGSKQKLKMWLLYVTTEYGSDSSQWKERKKRRRAWHSFEDARAIFSGIPEENQRPELLEILTAAESLILTPAAPSSRSKSSNPPSSTPGGPSSSAPNES